MTPAPPLKALAERWSTAKPAERANAQLYIAELCEAIGVEAPRPAGSGYEFELPVKLISRDGMESTGFIDCYKAGHFVLEAKDYEEGRSNDVLMRKAYGQARTYAAHDPSGVAPPYLLVLDVGKTVLVWDRWSGTFGGFPAARRIDLQRLHERPDDVALLVDIWTDPSARNPRLAAQVVTREIAAHLAELAAALEARGYGQERVAKFLMRCVFTMFAEDVGLLDDEPFRRLLDDIALPAPTEFPGGAEELWRAMDEGRRFGFRKLLRFNGHFFKDAEALPLTREDLAILLEAAKADWAKVEPTIFGTLLIRALDPVERHSLGAEYTPPEFIERLVRPTIEEPVRERWTAVQAEILQLRDAKDGKGKAKAKSRISKDRDAAEKRLLEFHQWLRTIRVLDPACGSGNFLYLAMHALKRVEVEVLHEIADVRGGALELRMHEVDPSQFYGIEVKPWAREIAELTLWIGFHQFWRQHHGDVQPEEPLLRDTGTLECRDAVLAWDTIVRRPDSDRPDPTPRIRHQVTGELVPDPEARLPYEEYLGARQALWPEADFIVGNPPYLGKSRQREAFGEGYVDALRAAYPDVPDSADFVMYWWYLAARAVASGRTLRAGLITTNSITQRFHQPIVNAAAEAGARVIWAISDHPWSVEGDAAAVRVAMTVLAKGDLPALRVEVDDDAQVVRSIRVPRLNADLTVGADLTQLEPLQAMSGLSVPGMQIDGAGFMLEADEAHRLLDADTRYSKVVRPYRNGRDLMAVSRDLFVIDFGLMTEDEATTYPLAFDIVRSRVYPQRQGSARASYRTYWWRFAEPRRTLREALQGLSRYIVTTRTARRRVFSFLPADVVPDSKLVCVASDDAYVLGVLSSTPHIQWAMAAGGRLGFGNDASYDKARCFDPFPFPNASAEQRQQIAGLADRIEAHRKRVLGSSPGITMTNVYAVVEKLRAAAILTSKERTVYEGAACGVLRDLHDALDSAVAAAYGWSWPEPSALVLERLAALSTERSIEEKAGTVRWLRPAFQVARIGAKADEASPAFELTHAAGEVGPPSWPTDVVDQITALRRFTATAAVSVDDVMSHFSGAPRAIIARHLETLAILGEVRPLADGRYTGALAAA